jgi:hypothetical protein
MKKYYITLIIILISNFAFSQNYKIKTVAQTDSTVKFRFYYNIKYPELIYANESTDQDKINNRISVEIHKALDNFFDDVKQSDFSDLSPEFTNEFSSDYTVYYSSDDLFSFSYEIYMYYAGSAHGYGYSKVMNIDISKVNVIDFSEMFSDTSSSLNFISEYCYSDLKTQSKTKETCIWDDEMLKETLKPEKNNYSNLAVFKDKLMVIFNPYEVACYAQGQVFVEIPLKLLSAKLNSSGPIYKLINK